MQARSSATSPRWAAKASTIYRTPPRSPCASCPTRDSSLVGDGELRQSLEDQIRHKHLEPRVPAGFRAMRGVDEKDSICLHELTNEGCAPHSGRDGGVQGRRDTDAGGISEVMLDGETGFSCTDSRSRSHGGENRAAAEEHLAARVHGRGGAAARAGAIHRRSDGRRDAGDLRVSALGQEKGQLRSRSRRSRNRRSGSCCVSVSARSYDSRASSTLPRRRHRSALAECAR